MRLRHRASFSPTRAVFLELARRDRPELPTHSVYAAGDTVTAVAATGVSKGLSVLASLSLRRREWR